MRAVQEHVGAPAAVGEADEGRRGIRRHVRPLVLPPKAAEWEESLHRQVLLHVQQRNMEQPAWEDGLAELSCGQGPAHNQQRQQIGSRLRVRAGTVVAAKTEP